MATASKPADILKCDGVTSEEFVPDTQEGKAMKQFRTYINF